MKKFRGEKKLAAVCLVGVMLLTLMAGCGTGSSSEADSSGESASTSSEGIAGMTDNGDGTYTVTVAVLDGMAPYTYTDENGDFQGYDYEYMLALDELLEDYTFEYVSAGADAAPAAIQAGTYAMSVSAHFVTPARAENYILSIPQSYYPVNLISRTEDSFTSFEELDGKTLVPNPPNDGLSVVLSQMAEEYPDVAYIQDPTSEYIPYLEGLEDVIKGKYDCWFGGESMYADLIASDSTFAETTFCSDPITTAACVCVINSSLTEFRDAVNEATVSLYLDGTLSELSTKWLGSDYFETAEETGSLFDYAGYTSDDAEWYK
ncbi:MAG: transporter substrate-binding domain-containing protein [Eubacterium sp.]|nr:transporter substrate-binding domain-containing protein [Eubacterium sp.]